MVYILKFYFPLSFFPPLIKIKHAISVFFGTVHMPPSMKPSLITPATSSLFRLTAFRPILSVCAQWVVLQSFPCVAFFFLLGLNSMYIEIIFITSRANTWQVFIKPFLIKWHLSTIIWKKKKNFLHAIIITTVCVLG